MWTSDLTSAMTLTLNFQGQIWNLQYLNQKWSDCHEMKSKHIDWTPGLKCDQWVWPSPWPWPLNFQVECDLDLCPHTWPWPWIFMVKFWNSCVSEWERRLTLSKGVGVGHSWPWLRQFGDQGARIYQIMTRVTSDVNMPWTHLVLYVIQSGNGRNCHALKKSS